MKRFIFILLFAASTAFALDISHKPVANFTAPPMEIFDCAGLDFDECKTGGVKVDLPGSVNPWSASTKAQTLPIGNYQIRQFVNFTVRRPEVAQAPTQSEPETESEPEPEPETEPEPQPEPQPEPTPITGVWTEAISASAYTSAAPTDGELTVLSAGGPNLRGVIGPSSVFSKWNGAAFDPETGTIYAHGGGHFDYAGNEVYKGRIDAGTWERVTDPSPYTGDVVAVDADDDEYRLPLDGPPSSHTYAGTVWNPDTKTIIFAGQSSNATFNGIGVAYPPYSNIDEFDPATKEWTIGQGADRMYYGSAVYVPTTKKVYAITDRKQIVLHADGVWRKGHGFDPKMRFSTTTYDFDNDEVWSISPGHIVRWTVTPNGLVVKKQRGIPVPVRDRLPGYTGIAVRNGLVWLYGGGGIVIYNPGDETFEYLAKGDDWPATNRVLNKFWYWPRRDLFVLVANGGIVYLLDPTGLKGKILDLDAKKAEVNGQQYARIQAAIDAAQPGDTVTILPGTYNEGIRVDVDDLTISAYGAKIDGGIFGAKAWAVLYGKNLTIEGIEAMNLNVPDGNAALVRTERQAAGVTIRDVYVHDSQGGAVVTGNYAGGDIIIERSKFERVGHGGQAHGVYAGRNIARVIIHDSEFIDGQGGGHLVKSRAAYTEIKNTILDGLDGNNSREIDIPEAGVLVLDGVTVRKGPNAENPDFIGYALETFRPWHAEQRMEFHNSTFINDYTGTTSARLMRVGDRANPQVPAPDVVCGDGNNFGGLETRCAE